MFNRDKAVQCLIDDDYNTIMSGDANDYLINLLTFGHKGYNDFTDDELMQELTERDISYLFGETE
jgi:hypothetical protein